MDLFRFFSTLSIEPPSYYGNHVVYSMPWSYPAELKSITIQLSSGSGAAGDQEEAAKTPPAPSSLEEHLVDFSVAPTASSSSFSSAASGETVAVLTPSASQPVSQVTAAGSFAQLLHDPVYVENLACSELLTGACCSYKP